MVPVPTELSNVSVPPCRSTTMDRGSEEVDIVANELGGSLDHTNAAARVSQPRHPTLHPLPIPELVTHSPRMLEGPVRFEEFRDVFPNFGQIVRMRKLHPRIRFIQ